MRAALMIPVLLASPQSNLLTKTTQFDDAAWSKVLSLTVTANQAVDPLGALSVDTINFSGTNANRLEQITTIPAVVGASYTGSVWLSGTGTMRIAVSSDTGNGGSIEPLITLTATLTRYSASHTFTAGADGFVRFMMIWRTGDTATAANAWRAKLERGRQLTAWTPG